MPELLNLCALKARIAGDPAKLWHDWDSDEGYSEVHYGPLTTQCPAGCKGVAEADIILTNSDDELLTINFPQCVEIIEALCDAANGLLFCAAMNAQDVPEPWKQHLDALSIALGRVEREEK